MKPWLLLALACLCARGEGAALPAWRFRVLTSAHFEVIYHDDQKPLATRYILAAERAREILMPIFKEGPENTIIFLSDDTDDANGSASFLPYPMITVYPVLPVPSDSIQEYGDWPFELILHEYTHILNMYPRHGFYWPLKFIFGDLVRPNAILPKWYLEGLAVNLESRMSDHGRLRADETRADARALVLGRRLREENIATINEQEIPDWPYGSRPYLYGGWWWQNAQNKFGQEVIFTWNQDFSRRLPWLLNGPLKDATKQKAYELFNEAQATTENLADHELSILKNSNAKPGSELVAGENNQSAFAISPNAERLVYFTSAPARGSYPHVVGSTAHVKTRAVGQSFSEGLDSKLFKSTGTLRLSWLDKDRFVFDQVDADAPYVNYRDLYLYDFTSKKITRLTHKARAEQAAASPSGQQIAMIQNEGGRTRLSALKFTNGEPGKIRTLVQGNYSQRLSAPEFLNDNELLFVMRSQSGQEKLFLYDFILKSVEPWGAKLTAVHNPRRTSLGVLVTDARTHVRNAYLLGHSRSEPVAVSNTLTHVEAVDFDPEKKEVFFSELTPLGRKLTSAPLDLEQSTPASLDAVDLPSPPRPQLTSVKFSDEEYQPLSYLRPRYWFPFVYSVENGGLLFEGTTLMSDPAGRNTYNINATYDTITKQPSLIFNYTNSSTPVEISPSYSRFVSYLGASGLTFQSEAEGLDFSGYWPLNNRHFKWTIGAVRSSVSEGLTLHQEGPRVGMSWNTLEDPHNTWNGFLFEFWHQQNLKVDRDDLSYGRTYGHLADVVQLGRGRRIFLQARAALAPQEPFGDVLVLGDRSVAANYLVNLANSDFLLRGYGSGAFVGRKIINANLEYSFPAWQLSKGFGTFPVFFKYLELAVFADTIAVDGGGYVPSQSQYLRTNLSEFFTGTGAELRLNTTVSYSLPVSFVLGAYYGLNLQFGGGFTPFVGFGLGDFGSLQNKTP